MRLIWRKGAIMVSMLFGVYKEYFNTKEKDIEMEADTNEKETYDAALKDENECHRRMVLEDNKGGGI